MSGSSHAIDLLVEKLTEATGPSRELDAEIAVLANPRGFKFGSGDYLKIPTRHDEVEPGHYWLVSRSGMSLHGAPKFTESIDAALTLVPEGLSFELARYADEAAYVNLWSKADPITPFGRGKIRVKADGKTAAIALCIAVLKALRARKGGEG